MTILIVISALFAFTRLPQKISVFIHLDVANERYSIKYLHHFYISAKQIKICL